ncbi:MAG: FIST C-terminal domain-containing protein [SAR324 cluster bacterium]|nr:FIST C-terminal domain-containing protein [SAR324 cluster bacterium]
MLKAAIGHTEDIDTEDAIDEILEQCKQELGDLKAQAGILYSSVDHEFDVLLEKINAEYPDIELIGCTTDGEMSSAMGFAEDSVLLILFYSDEVDIKSGVAKNLSENMEQNIAAAIEDTKAKSQQEAKFCVFTSVSITQSVEVILQYFKSTFGEKFPIFGGAAADQWKFEQTYQFHKTEVLKDAVPFLIFSGPILFGSGVQSGWTSIGQPGIITKVENNVVYTIDGFTAEDFFKKYLGENIFPLGVYPLAVFESDTSEKFYLRAPLVLNEEEGSIVFAGDIAPNTKVQLTHSTHDKIIKASEQSVSQSIEKYPGKKPEIALCFSCSGRKQVLGTRTNEEYELLKTINPELKVFGFYGYGEIAPIQMDNPSRFHNETFVSLLLGVE